MPQSTERLSSALADRYRILRHLGEGGMATVFLAEDLKHKRQVAVKVLKPELAAVLGAERFLQEITTTASLQHPHILPLFDSGEADSFLYYVMPYIEGETLRSKLDRETQFGIDEAVKITTDVADALDYAHRHGIIHRDIKPENILLHDGRPMVADFGIALAVSAAAGGRMTETGLSLGTPHYMSPEQATAEKEITARSDVYSLGSVLYEMLAGAPPHLGGSAQQIIMKIITEDAAAVTTLRKSVPANVAAATAKSLEKLPADRFASAADFSAALTDPTFAPVGTVSSTGALNVVAGSQWSTRALATTALLAVALAAWSWLRPTPAPPVIRYGLKLPASQTPDPEMGAPTPAPDGSYIVYVGPAEGTGGPLRQLWMKQRDSYAAVPIPGTLRAESFALSPDGESIAFAGGAQLKTLPVVGGAAITLADAEVAGEAGVAWLDDGTIAYVDFGLTGNRLLRVPSTGGEPSLVWESDNLFAISPAALPGSRALLFAVCDPQGLCDLMVADLQGGGTARLVVRGARTGLYLATGHLLFVVGDGLQAVPFDLDRLEVRGSPTPLADDMSGSLFPVRASASGMVLMRVGGAGVTSREFAMLWVDRAGRETPVDTGWTFRVTSRGNNHGWALSPDGSRLAIGLATDAGDNIWMKRLPQGPVSRLSFENGSQSRPRWSPDGRSVTYVSLREVAGLYQRPADGTGSESLLYGGSLSEGVVSPDGDWLIVREGLATAAIGGRNITGFRPGTDTGSVPLIVTPFDEEAFALSPDGRWLAYQSNETGQTDVFVRSFPDTDAGKWQVSDGGGEAPLWSRDGRELIYLSGAKDMMAVEVSTVGAALELSRPERLFHVRDGLLAVETSFYTPWDVAPDGRFIMADLLRTDPDAGVLIVVENFFEELKDKVGQ